MTRLWANADGLSAFLGVYGLCCFVMAFYVHEYLSGRK